MIFANLVNCLLLKSRCSAICIGFLLCACWLQADVTPNPGIAGTEFVFTEEPLFGDLGVQIQLDDAKGGWQPVQNMTKLADGSFEYRQTIHNAGHERVYRQRAVLPDGSVLIDWVTYRFAVTGAMIKDGSGFEPLTDDFFVNRSGQTQEHPNAEPVDVTTGSVEDEYILYAPTSGNVLTIWKSSVDGVIDDYFREFNNYGFPRDVPAPPDEATYNRLRPDFWTEGRSFFIPDPEGPFQLNHSREFFVLQTEDGKVQLWTQVHGESLVSAPGGHQNWQTLTGGLKLVGEDPRYFFSEIQIVRISSENFVAVWSALNGIYGQILHVGGGAETEIFQIDESDERRVLLGAQVAYLGGGDFVVCWIRKDNEYLSDDVQALDGGDGWDTAFGVEGISDNLYFTDDLDENGVYDVGEDVWVSDTGTFGGSGSRMIFDTTQSDTSGGRKGTTGLFFHDANRNRTCDLNEDVWMSSFPDRIQVNLYGRIFRFNGSEVVAPNHEFRISSGYGLTTVYPRWSVETVNAMGDFVVCWHATGYSGGVMGRLANRSGQFLTDQVILNQSSDGRHETPHRPDMVAIANSTGSAADGDIAVSWLSYDNDAPTPTKNFFLRTFKVPSTSEVPDLPYYLRIVDGSGVGNGYFFEGAEIAVTAAAPEDGYKFSHWSSSNGGAFVQAEAPTTIFVMPPASTTLRAHFVEVVVTIDVGGGSGAGTFSPGETAVLTADNPPQGQRFSHWSSSNGGDFEDAFAPSTTFTVPEEDTVVTAHFEAIPTYRLTVVNGTDLTGAGSYQAGEVVDVQADLAPGDQFLHWGFRNTYAGTFGSLTQPATTFTMPATHVTIIAYRILANRPPVFSRILNVVACAPVNTYAAISFAAIHEQGNAVDGDGSVQAYKVLSVNSGSLLFGSDPDHAAPWIADVDTNSKLRIDQTVLWMPPTDASGTLEAFTVVAVDDEGALSDVPVQVNVFVYASPEDAFSYSLVLNPGFNLKSVPVQPTDDAVAAVFGGHKVWRWDGRRLRPATTILPGHGYYVFNASKSEALVAFSGTIPPVTTRSVERGWHLVGPIGCAPFMSRQLPLATTPALSASNTAWFRQNRRYARTSAITPGSAVWIRFSIPCIVELGLQ